MLSTTPRKKVCGHTQMLTRFALWGLAIWAFTLITSPILSPAHAAQAALECGSIGDINGHVFLDQDANGVKAVSESGVANVTLALYADDETLLAQCQTASDGSFAFEMAADAYPVRLQVVTYPDALYPSAQADSPYSHVNFLTAPQTVDIGLSSASAYCQDNPSIAVACYSFGSHEATTAFDVATLARLPFDTVDGVDEEVPEHHVAATLAEVGSVWGLAYDSHAEALYASAFMKRHSGFGPAGTNGIYKIHNNQVSLFATIYAGEDPHPAASDQCESAYWGGADNYNCWWHDRNSWDPVGKVGFGDMDLSSDGSTLFIVNLFDRRLYALPLADPSAMSSVAIPEPAGCPDPANNFRPFGLGVEEGAMLVGSVCTAETTQSMDDLAAYVYRYDVATSSFDATPLLVAPLAYGRGCLVGSDDAACVSAAWRPWVSEWTNLRDMPVGFAGYPQPWLTNIEIVDDRMVLGIRDRFGDQSGFELGHTILNYEDVYTGIPAGDMLGACKDVDSGSWLLEANASCGDVTTAGAGNGQGPAGGEYYFDDHVTSYDELSFGSMVHSPGDGQMIVTMSRPATSGDGAESAGFRWIDESTAAAVRYARIYENSDGQARLPGLGDVVLECRTAPIEIGNRVWLDANVDGRQNAGEGGVAGMLINLYTADGAGGFTLLDSAVTDDLGHYQFGSLAASTTYYLVMEAVAGNGADENHPSGATANNVVDEEIDDNIDFDNVIAGEEYPWAGYDMIVHTTGAPGSNDHTLDFRIAMEELGEGDEPTAVTWSGSDADGLLQAPIVTAILLVTVIVFSLGAVLRNALRRP